MDKEKIEYLLEYWKDKEKTAENLIEDYVLAGYAEGEQRVIAKLSMVKSMRAELERAMT